MAVVITPATVEVVTPQHRGIISDDDQARIRAALDGRDAAEQELRAAVLTAVKHGASVRELNVREPVDME